MEALSDDTPLLNRVLEGIQLNRCSGRVLERCDVCTKRKKMEETEMGLEIALPYFNINLCHQHEAQLLQRLLINHCKRTRKRAVKGLKPDYYLEKEPGLVPGEKK